MTKTTVFTNCQLIGKQQMTYLEYGDSLSLQKRCFSYAQRRLRLRRIWRPREGAADVAKKPICWWSNRIAKY